MEGPDGQLKVRQVDDFDDFLRWPDLELLVIDVPIGLPDRGARKCDLRARQILGPRASSVFPAPIRPALNARSHEGACRIWERIEGKRCSVQAFGIYSTIASVDRHMVPGAQERVREGHPELTFAHMNGGRGLELAKSKADGRERRIELLEPHFVGLEALISELRPRRAIVDLLDALAMLWTARRVRKAEATSIPDQPEYDSRGLRMEMVA